MLTVLTPPASEPATLAEAKAQCRVTYDDEDALFTRWVKSAREQCEAAVSRAFLTTSFRLTLWGFPCAGVGDLGIGGGFGRDDTRRWLERMPFAGDRGIRLPRAPVQTVDAVSYIDVTGARVVLDPSLYLYEAGDACILSPAYGRTWPAARAQAGSVRVDFTAGYGALASACPGSVGEAILLLVNHKFVNRAGEAEVPGCVLDVLSPLDWGYTTS